MKRTSVIPALLLLPLAAFAGDHGYMGIMGGYGLVSYLKSFEATSGPTTLKEEDSGSTWLLGLDCNTRNVRV
jgi:hypothetical protein